MKNCNIGGQALIEGIMMRNGEDYAIGIRLQNGSIHKKVSKTVEAPAHKLLKRIPVVRGIVSFISSMALGYDALSYSAGIYELEESNEEQIAMLDNKKKGASERLITTLTLLLSFGLSISLFIILPYFLASILSRLGAGNILISLAEGLIRILIFLGYLSFVSNIKDIKRVLMYHGAEHKCINCIENEMQLNIENVRAASRFHKRCGTGFLFYIIAVSIILFMLIRVDIIALRILIRLLLVPLIAGISYELLKATGRTDNALIRIISLPALFFQRFTTKEPEDDMIEVAIAAVNEIYSRDEEDIADGASNMDIQSEAVG